METDIGLGPTIEEDVGTIGVQGVRRDLCNMSIVIFIPSFVNRVFTDCKVMTPSHRPTMDTETLKFIYHRLFVTIHAQSLEV